MSEKDKLPWGLKQVTPGSIKGLSKDKLEAFDQGSVFAKKHLSKKELEELKKKVSDANKIVSERNHIRKIKQLRNLIFELSQQDDEAAAVVLKDFEATFVHDKKMPKMFIKGAVINPSNKGNRSNYLRTIYAL